jgi:hypothetical protein
VAQSEKRKRSIRQDRACDTEAEKIKELMVGRSRLWGIPLGSTTRRMRIKLSLNAAASLSAINFRHFSLHIFRSRRPLLTITYSGLRKVQRLRALRKERNFALSRPER